MTSLSACLSPKLIEKLKMNIRQGFFSGIDFEQAMQFILTEGHLPASNLPIATFLKLETWVLNESNDRPLEFTATELKNKTGLILEQVLSGRTVHLFKHGRAIAEIKRIEF